MRARTLAATLLLVLSGANGMRAQGTAGGEAVAPGLVVWRVVAGAFYLTGVGPPPQLATATVGSFGQAASSTGTAASNAGQTAGSFGQSASSTGTAASNAGQTAGSFGQSLGGLAHAAAVANGSAIQTKKDVNWDRFTDGVEQAFHGLNVSYVDVGADVLEARLAAAAGTADAPDLVVGTPLPSSWSNPETGLVRRFGLVTVGDVGLVPQTETPETISQTFRPEVSILRAAPHPRAARQFVMWLYDKSPCLSCESIPRGTELAVATAKSALYNVLNGTSVGGAIDPEMAKFDAAVAQQMAFATGDGGLLGGFRIRMSVTAAQANLTFAVVTLRAVVENGAAFGLAHAVVVLRTDDKGRWRVLQVTPNLQLDQQTLAWTTLRGYGATVKRESVAIPLGIGEAAPPDGDNRERSPDLWWDNKGGATLEVVEWQRGAGESWTASNMFFVPDSSGHLRTRVTGRFADAAGHYRWRIWMVADGGAMAISPWRTFNVLGR